MTGTYNSHHPVTNSPVVRGSGESITDTLLGGVSTVFNGASSAVSWVWDEMDYAPEFTRWAAFGLGMLGLVGAASKGGVFNLLGDNIISQALCFVAVLGLAAAVMGPVADYLGNKGADRVKLPDGTLGPHLSQTQGGNGPASAYEREQTALVNNPGRLNGTFGDAVANRSPAPPPQAPPAPDFRPDMFPELAALR